MSCCPSWKRGHGGVVAVETWFRDAPNDHDNHKACGCAWDVRRHSHIKSSGVFCVFPQNNTWRIHINFALPRCSQIHKLHFPTLTRYKTRNIWKGCTYLNREIPTSVQVVTTWKPVSNPWRLGSTRLAGRGGLIPEKLGSPRGVAYEVGRYWQWGCLGCHILTQLLNSVEYASLLDMCHVSNIEELCIEKSTSRFRRLSKWGSRFRFCSFESFLSFKSIYTKSQKWQDARFAKGHSPTTGPSTRADSSSVFASFVGGLGARLRFFISTLDRDNVASSVILN